MSNSSDKKCSFGYSALTIGLCVALLLLVTLVFKGKIQVGFLLAIVLAYVMAMIKGYKHGELEAAAYEFAKKAMTPMMFLFATGIMIAMWISCGAVPTIIYYGLKLINPSIFLLIALLLCSIGSVCTGTSWGTMGSIGIAMMGIGAGLGINPNMTAAAVICGSMFGDKMSPLSDTTNLCPAVVGTDVMTHVKHMFYTTVPSYVVSIVFFLVLGIRHSGTAYDQSLTLEIMDAIKNNCSIGFVQVLPVILVLVLLVMQKPAFLSIMAGGISGFFVSVLFKTDSIPNLLTYMYSGYKLESGMALVDNLFSRGGAYSMCSIVMIQLFACVFAGILHKCGMFEALVTPLVKLCKSNGALITVSGLVCAGINLTGSMTMAQVLTGTVMKSAYDQKKLAPENLSRVLEDFGTFTSALIPWHNTGVYIVSTLAVGPGYIPFCILLWLTPLIDIIYGFTGFGIKKLEEETAKVD